MKFINKNKFLFVFNLCFYCTFSNKILSYFAEPNFIIYDEWFDDDLEKTKIDFKNKKIKTTKNVHEFFYELSNHKIGASENNMQLDIKDNKKEHITNNYYFAGNYRDNISESYYPLSNKFKLFKKFTKSKLKFNITKKLLYSLSILSVLLIFGFLIFFIFTI